MPQRIKSSVLRNVYSSHRIAVGAAAGIYWRKAKKKIDKSLGIDENRNKEVESDDIMLDQAEDKQEK